MLKIHNKTLLKCALVLPFIVIVDYCGILTHLFEKDFNIHYQYPLQRNDTATTASSSRTIDSNTNYEFLKMPRYTKDRDRSRLTILIKSAIGNRQRRDAIRKTWGYESRFSDVNIRRAFLLGTLSAAAAATAAADDDDIMITNEAKEYGDILYTNFIDTYFNNTIKTISGLRWASQHYNNSDFYMFVDDDYYVSIKNVLKFLGRTHQDNNAHTQLFAGYVIESAPLRHKFSKWYVSLEEYPFDRWPPYVTAGAFIMSQDTLQRLYAQSRNLPLFRFDDIYLGIVALKAHVPLHHCQRFHFYRPRYTGPDSYSDVIAAHGFSDPIEMERVWNECRSANYA